jgi:hypothetical protein
MCWSLTSCIVLQGFVFFGANFLAAAFVFCFVPEMAGLSLEEINGLFQAGVPAHKSYSYNIQVRQKDRKNQEIIEAGGVARLGGQDLRDEKSDSGDKLENV